MRYLVSLKGYLPRSTILYPTLAGEAADQAVRLKDPALGDKRARKADGLSRNIPASAGFRELQTCRSW
jgi:hypothetical protein